MKIRKELAWKNRKCNECGNQICTTIPEGTPVYIITLGFTIANTWYLCEKCFKRIFPHEYEKMEKTGK